MCTRARCFFARFNRLKLSAPLVEASPGHPELLGQLIDAHTGPHALYGHALELPGISLSSLHSCFLSRRVCPSRVCQFKGSFHFYCRQHGCQLETCPEVKNQCQHEPQAEIPVAKRGPHKFFESVSKSYRSGKVRNDRPPSLLTLRFVRLRLPRLRNTP